MHNSKIQKEQDLLLNDFVGDNMSKLDCYIFALKGNQSQVSRTNTSIKTLPTFHNLPLALSVLETRGNQNEMIDISNAHIYVPYSLLIDRKSVV